MHGDDLTEGEQVGRDGRHRESEALAGHRQGCRTAGAARWDYEIDLSGRGIVQIGWPSGAGNIRDRDGRTRQVRTIDSDNLVGRSYGSDDTGHSDHRQTGWRRSAGCEV